MITTIRAGWLAAVLLCAAVTLNAQTSVQEELQRADKQYDLYAYNLALRSYDAILKKDPVNGHALARIADCYFQLNKPEESLQWYEKAAYNSVTEPEVLLRYGKALMQTGDYIGAKKWFIMYAADNEAVGRHFADMCDYALKVAGKEALYSAKNETLNTTNADFGAAFLGNRVVYNSARTDIVRKTDSKSNSDWTGSANNQLFVTQRNPENGYLQKPVFLRADMQNNYNEGPVSFSSDGRRVVFCRNKFIDGTRQIADKGLEMSLYTADISNGNWTNVKAFPYNGSNYATGFPSISPDGNTLVFASNNPEGNGGWDLYVSNWNGSTWTAPRNLGATINTAGNEVTPFYDGLNLFFSSDWHRGLGGLDVFRAELGSDAVKNIYHLGPGINSSRDDYGFVYDASINIGYLTSNRAEGRGNEDIWQITKKIEAAPVTTTNPAPVTYSTTTNATPTTTTTTGKSPSWSENVGNGALYILVTDASGNPVSDADVDLSSCGGGVGRTDASGKYYFSSLSKAVKCDVTVRKKGYEDTYVQLEYYGKNNIVVAIASDDRQDYTGYVYDTKTKKALSGVVIEYEQAGMSIQTSTDYEGRYVASLNTRTTYDILYTQPGYLDATVKTRPEATSRSLPPVLMIRTGDVAVEKPVTYSTISPVVEYNAPTTTLIASPVKKEDPGPANGYSIQLGADPNTWTQSRLQKFEDLSQYGNLYAKSEDNLNKIRLGIYPTKQEAQDVWKKVVKDPKFKDAFVVEEHGADETFILGSSGPGTAPVTYSTTSKGVQNPTPTPVTIPNSDIRYAVQIGSYATDKAIPITDIATKLSGLGNVYSKTENNNLKIRVGVWANHAEAENAKEESIKRGFPDALVITEKANDENIKNFLLESSSAATEKTPAPVTYSTTTTATPAPEQKVRKGVDPANNYMIRLATLSGPDSFDTNWILGMGGTLEKRQATNGMTIFLLSGFPDLESVTSAHTQLVDRGMKDSYIVKDENGKLVRVK